ncbi:hypothetical protein [Sphingomonas sp.]|uniref:hypothetical protein n=1 Tax=Sphingomonas sp. TaxID=28214 RepID=UPI003B3BC1F9
MTDPHRVSPHNDRIQPRISAAADAEARKVKIGGVIATVAGLFILVLMGIVTWRMAPMLLAAPAQTADGSRFNATQHVASLVLALFGTILLFGGVAVAVGLMQATTGERRKGPLYALWAAAALIVAMVILVIVTIKQMQPQ